jgi:MoaA/NifB/PqqE/SkfB family radical SAM enzyme
MHEWHWAISFIHINTSLTLDKFIMIDTIYLDKLRMTVVWDLGRRCNYDCTYCTSWMHSLTAPFNKLEQYKRTANFIDQYFSFHSMYHKQKVKLHVSFTGGEPTINPDFYPLVEYMKEKFPYMDLGLTTNGTWGTRRGEFIAKNFEAITVSYHCEGTDKQKKLLRSNLAFLKDKIKFKVNVMMHQDHWDECVDFMENFLEPNGYTYIPRTIGDDGKYKSDWFKDEDGEMRRTTHNYTPEQQEYLRTYWNKKNTEVGDTKTNIIVKDSHAQNMGRMCCGGRCMTVEEGSETRDTMFIDQSNFKGWQCMINWFFLHIEEDKDAIYHHQTCQARTTDIPELITNVVHSSRDFRPEVGPITSITNCDQYLDWLEENGPVSITCPKKFCGCGICVPKSSDPQKFEEIKQKYLRS